MSSLVSIVIPVYNSSSTIDRCVQSVLAQSYTNIEVILINDGSTDNSLEIIKQYALKDRRVIVVDQKNAGPSRARNVGMEKAIGDYLVFIDSDDYVEIDLVQKCMHAIMEHNCDMVIYGFIYEGIDEQISRNFSYSDGLYSDEECEALAVELIDNNKPDRIPSYSPIRLTRRTIFTSSGIKFHEGIKRSEDYLFWTLVFFQIKSVYLMGNEKLYHYVVNKNSITNSYLPGYWNMIKQLYHVLLEKLPYKQSIRDKLDNMLVQRSLVALHNSSCESSLDVFESDCNQILDDKELRAAILHVGLIKGTIRSRIYCVLVLLGLKRVVIKLFSENIRRKLS